jgi:putative DNA primase/helicase
MGQRQTKGNEGMRFEDFARVHGLILNSLQLDRWIPTPTEDHPRSSNGRYKFLGNVGWVQNWATMDKPATWFAEGHTIDSPQIKKSIDESRTRQIEAAERASKKAGWILHQTELKSHPYLVSKGFPEELGNVWVKDGKELLVIPMRIDGRIVGVQLIDDEGNKKFLHGQTTKGASFCMNAKGIPMFCEGYATALSIRECMKASNIKYAIYVCFSASNMKHIARTVGGGFIVADNDPNCIGEKTAKETGKPYWLSETVGDDFNDYHQRVGTFRASQNLKKVLLSAGTLIK